MRTMRWRGVSKQRAPPRPLCNAPTAVGGTVDCTGIHRCSFPVAFNGTVRRPFYRYGAAGFNRRASCD